jgi:MoxR-like ATPase
MHVNVAYPDAEAEIAILQLVRNENQGVKTQSPDKISQTVLFAARQEILQLHMDPSVEQYIVQLVIATREAHRYDEEFAGYIEFGVSPRATIALDRCARAHAWLQGKDYVSPDDVQAIIHDVLRHRLIISYEAEANNISRDDVISRLLELVAVG